MRKLPPLNAIKAFEAAALHLSFSKAAKELGVTQGAVSKQIKLLEAYLGFPVFERMHQSLKLTEDGKKYLVPITKAFDVVETATILAKEKYSRNETLRINILPSMTSNWLVPLLEGFHEKHPNIRIHMDIGYGDINLTTAKADIAIRVARKPLWPRYYSEKFMDENLLPVYSAELKKQKPIKQVDDLKQHKLLRHTSRPEMWSEYLHDIGYPGFPAKHGNGFEHFFMLIEAVQDSMGVGLIPEFLISRQLDAKKLHIAFKSGYKSPYGYYFICRKDAVSERKVALFRKWLLTVV